MTTDNKFEADSSPRGKGLGTEKPARPRWWRRRATWLWLGLLLPAGLVGAHGVLWYVACTQMTAQLTVELRNLARDGWSTFADAPVWSGYPWAAQVTVPGLRAAGPLVGWESETLVMRQAMLRPTTIRLSAEGRQTLRLGDGPVLVFTANRAEALISLVTPDIVAVELDGLVADKTAGPAITLASLRARLDRAAMTLAADATDVAVPADFGLPLGTAIARLGLDVAMLGGVPADVTRPALSAWRDGGGRIEVTRAMLEWGAVRLVGQGKIALDAKLLPELTGRLQLGGYKALIDALVGSGALPPRPARALGAVLGLLARPSDATGPDSVEVPFTLRDGRLDVGRIPLLRVPEITWRAGK